MKKALPSSTKVVVIGGGVAGCSVAYHLAKFGWKDTILLERDQLTSGTTWHAAGLIGQLGSSATITKLRNYSLNLYNESNKTKKDLTEQKQLVMNDLNAMAKQYDAAISENTIAKNDLIEARDRIQGLMDSLKISQNSVNSLWRYKKKFLALQEEMDVLLTENDKLKIENALLATSLDSTQVQLAERTMFTDSLLVQNTALAEVVEDATIDDCLATDGLIFGPFFFDFWGLGR